MLCLWDGITLPQTNPNPAWVLFERMVVFKGPVSGSWCLEIVYLGSVELSRIDFSTTSEGLSPQPWSVGHYIDAEQSEVRSMGP